MSTALVTGASRGVGRGIAIGLDECGFRVFGTGRSIESADLPGTVVRIPCDHLRDEHTTAAVDRIAAQGGLDLLVNNAWGGYEHMVEDGRFTWGVPFWEQPLHRWTSMMDIGVRAAFVTTAAAVRVMLPHRHGLIVNISFWPAQKYIGNTIYGIAKAATDKMTADMAHELKPHGIAVLSLYPGLVRTEAVLRAAEAGWMNLENSESPQFIGRVIAALNGDRRLMERTGQVVIAAAAAIELGVTDIDGRQPSPLSLDSV